MMNVTYRSATSDNDCYEEPVIEKKVKPPTDTMDDFFLIIISSILTDVIWE